MIEEFPTDTCAIEGEGVLFTMAVRGYPQPTLTWYCEGSELIPDYSLELQQDGSLSISSSELRHNGVYKLVAKNCKGSAEREVRLTVSGEEEETAAVDKERLEVPPIPIAEFGEYVAKNHSHSDELFKLQYNVCVKMNELAKLVKLELHYNEV